MPNFYGNYQYPNYPNYQQPIQQQPVQQQQQAQNGGFLVVPNEEIINTYPVAPGSCVTFKVEGKPIVLEKSMGFSQFEPPKIDRYRLIKEERIEEVKEETDPLSEVKDEIKSLWKEIDSLKGRRPIKKKEVSEDDPD